MKLLVTGCSGFLGGCGARAALARGHEVIGVTLTEEAHPFPSFQLDVRGEGVAALIRDERPDAILHAAGGASVGASVSEPFDDFNRAVLTWARILESARIAPRRPVLLFPSSAAVYGNPVELPIKEGAALNPISPYGVHKVLCETLADEYARFFQLDVIVARVFSVVGPTQRRLLVWELCSQLANDSKTLSIQGTGDESRDFLHEADLGVALVALLERAHEKAVGGSLEIVNVASGVEVKVRDIAEMLLSRAPDRLVVCRGEERRGDPLRWRADTSRLRSLLPGWSPRSFAAALTDCLADWQPAHAES